MVEVDDAPDGRGAPEVRAEACSSEELSQLVCFWRRTSAGAVTARRCAGCRAHVPVSARAMKKSQCGLDSIRAAAASAGVRRHCDPLGTTNSTTLANLSCGAKRVAKEKRSACTDAARAWPSRSPPSTYSSTTRASRRKSASGRAGRRRTAGPTARAGVPSRRHQPVGLMPRWYSWAMLAWARRRSCSDLRSSSSPHQRARAPRTPRTRHRAAHSHALLRAAGEQRSASTCTPARSSCHRVARSACSCGTRQGRRSSTL